MDDRAIIVAFVGSLISIIIACGGWIFAWLKDKHIEELREANLLRAQRQNKVDRVLAYLDDMADLASHYRMLANYSSRLITDDYNQPLTNLLGEPEVEERSLFPDERREYAIREIEGKDIRGYINIRAYQVHRKLSEIGDLVTILDPGGDARSELGDLCLTVINQLERASHSGTSSQEDFWSFVNALDDFDSRRVAMRKQLQGFVDPAE